VTASPHKNCVFRGSPNSLPLEEGGFVQQNRKELCKSFPPLFIMGISAKTFCLFNSLSHGYAVPAPEKLRIFQDGALLAFPLRGRGTATAVDEV